MPGWESRFGAHLPRCSRKDAPTKRPPQKVTFDTSILYIYIYIQYIWIVHRLMKHVYRIVDSQYDMSFIQVGHHWGWPARKCVAPTDGYLYGKHIWTLRLAGLAQGKQQHAAYCMGFQFLAWCLVLDYLDWNSLFAIHKRAWECGVSKTPSSIC